MFARTFSFWNRLVGRPETAGPAPGDAEENRRVWLRYPANLEASFQAAGDASRFSGRVRDISRGGANLTTNRALQPGDLLSMELPGLIGQTHNVLACVVRTTALGQGEWALGCIFSRELSDDDLLGFGARRQQHGSSDQRTWIRFPCDVRASYQTVGGLAPSHSAQVLNISASGVGLLVAEAIETGTLLTVELHPATGTETRTILACVVHAAAQGPDQWALGCNFIRELSEHDLQTLVAS